MTPSPPPPLESGRAPGWVAAALLAAWYVATMARGLMWFDCGELALVGETLGLGHPPGQPLYTLMLAVAARLPGIDPLVAMNALSALCAALCAVPADALLVRMGQSSRSARVLTLLAAGGLAPVWDQATRIELYAPAALLTLVLLAAGASVADRGRHRAWSWLGLGTLVGLNAGVNPILATTGAAAVGLYALPSLWRARALPRSVGAAFVGSALGCASYAYLLWVRTRPEALVWGDLATAEGTRDFLLGADYRHTAHAAFASVPAHLADWLGWLGRHGGLPALLVGVGGWLLHGPARRRIILFALPVVAGVGFSMTYGVYFPDVPDFNGYLMPALWLAVLGAGGLATHLRPRLGTAVLLVALVSTLVSLERPIWHRGRADVDMPAELAAAWLAEMPPNGLLIVESDHLVFPLMYAQEARGQRVDVVLINAGWAASGWYWRHLYQRHPTLARIPLAAPSSDVRLRRLLLAEPDRVARVESIELAGRLGVRPCPATWGLVLGRSCRLTVDQPDAFDDRMAAWWRTGAGRDLISRRVLARLARDRAAGHWALGAPHQAITALRAGIDPEIAHGLPLPDAPTPVSGPLPSAGRTLIGDPRANLQIGAEALRRMGELTLAAAWSQRASSVSGERPINGAGGPSGDQGRADPLFDRVTTVATFTFARP